MRLLLVEDDRMIGESLRAALRLEGHAVDWVRDAAAAHATLASERFDLVLLDLGLPQAAPSAGLRDGWRAARAARPRRRHAGDRADRARRPAATASPGSTPAPTTTSSSPSSWTN